MIVTQDVTKVLTVQLDQVAFDSKGKDQGLSDPSQKMAAPVKQLLFECQNQILDFQFITNDSKVAILSFNEL